MSDARDMVGYEGRLHQLPYAALLVEAHRVGASIFPDITRPILIARILEVQGLSRCPECGSLTWRNYGGDLGYWVCDDCKHYQHGTGHRADS